MKANELMLGDWVTFKDCQHENPMPIKIIAIGFQADEEDDCLVQINGDKACDIITIDDEIVGIPLTAEILEKNGWRQYSPYFSNDNADFELEPYRDGGFGIRVSADEYGSGTFACIKYVHQLQHASRLCGIKREIEL